MYQHNLCTNILFHYFPEDNQFCVSQESAGSKVSNNVFSANFDSNDLPNNSDKATSESTNKNFSVYHTLETSKSGSLTFIN